jgi:glycosyltransferase involved in cell wall biosynthesis
VVLHAGTVYGPSQDLSALLDALRRAADAGEAPRLRLAGKVDAWTRGLVERAGVGPHVDLPGFLPSAAIAGEARGAAGLLLLGWNGRERAAPTIVPAKTYEYLAAGRPVLALTPPGTELGRLLDGVRGVTVATFDDGAAIERWLRRAGRGERMDAPPAEAARPYTRAAQAAALAALLDEVAAARVGGR